MSGLVNAFHNRFGNEESRYDENRRYPAIACPSYEDAVNPDNQRRIPPTMPYLTPYLGLRARLSQVWFNRWTLLLFLILVRVLLATQSLDSDLDSARDKALSACTGVESMGSAMASMPHYMSKGVNEMAAKGIEAAVHALEATLLMLITAIQEIVIFVINLVTSTYVCLITLAVKGSVGVVVDATKEITGFIDDTMSDIFNGITREVKGIQDTLNKITDNLGKVPSFFGSDFTIPKVEFGSLDKLKEIKIPQDFTKKLDALEESIPDFKTVQKAANDVIRIPFQKIHQSVNDSLSVYDFDRSVFPVPQKEKLTFCSDNPAINDFFDKLVKVVITVKWILVGVLVAAAIIAIAPMAYREIQKWRMTRSRAYMLADPNHQFDPIDVVMIASRPHSSDFGLRMASRFNNTRHQILVRWAVAYVTSPAALFVLALGIAGLAGVLCQYILLKQVEDKAPELAAEVGEFAGLVVEKLNAASTAWGEKTNQAIATTNDELNKEVFGWVKEGTDSLNATLNTFVDKMSEGVDMFLGDTPLKGPVQDVLDCLIVFKVQGIQKGITWVHEHAHVTFPRLPVDTFSLGASSSIGSDASGSESFLSSPDAVASDQITDVVMKLTGKWEKMLYEEAVISGCIVAIWGICVLIALIRTMVLFNGKDKNRGEGGSMPAAFYPGDPSAQPQQRTMYTGESSAGGSWGQRNNTAAVNPFPMFNSSPSDTCTPKTPMEFSSPSSQGSEKEEVRVGVVRGGMNSLETGRNRDSIYPTTDYKR